MDDYSQERVQTVVFLRHAVAVHNVRDINTGRHPNPHDEAFFDPPLISHHPLGEQAAVRAGEAIVKEIQKLHVDGAAEPTCNYFISAATSSSSARLTNASTIQLIVTSPLTRCIQTTMLAFASASCHRSGGANESSAVDRDIHWNGNETDSSKHSAAPLLTPLKSDQRLPVIIHESVREAFGRHYTDRRRSKTDIQTILERQDIHLSWHFDPAMAEDDTLWSVNSRETQHDVQDRVQYFLNWLVQRPESTIVVVTHGVWMEVCLKGFLQNRVYNCHAYTSQVISKNSCETGTRMTDESSSHQVFLRLQNVRRIYNDNDKL
ncbi:hypothetical protein MPSEU_001040700 [Mayamaea pseudoterrestris]|nr:hypothetical protein MPSEU_001040700 [Mayamaea pseudoterrestris]